MVALAAPGLLAEVAAERPLLCVVDDAQWLDAASAEVLGFVARRLLAESVALVFAVRDRPDQLGFPELPELAIGGLSTAEARALLASAVPGRLDAGVRDRLIAETRGNPLALLELTRGSAPGAGTGRVRAGAGSGVSERIQQSFLQRLEGLPEGLARCCWSPRRSRSVTPCCCGVRPSGSGSAVTRLRRGCWRSASASPSFILWCGRRSIDRRRRERRAVHLTLADVTDPRPSPTAVRGISPRQRSARRGGRLGTGAIGGPGAVRGEAGRGGRVPAALGRLDAGYRAADGTRARRRSGQLARRGVRCGARGARRGGGGGARQAQGARVDLLRGEIALASGSAAEAAPLLLKAARRLEPLDLPRARETYLSACGAAMFAGPAGADDLVRVGRAVTGAPATQRRSARGRRTLGRPRAADRKGRSAAAPTLLQAASSFAGDGAPTDESLRWGWMATAASNALWDDDGLRAVCRRQIELARDAGALEQLPIY